MCVKIISACQEKLYDASKPLEEQIVGCDQILINYELFDKSVDKLLQEMQRFVATGIDAKLNIKVIHNDNLLGYKVKKKLKQATNDITLNEIIKLMVLSHAETDKKLEELMNNIGQLT